jgi:hypothetical protein
MDITKIPIPVALASRPRDSRGYPIPFFQFVPRTFENDRKVDFTITDPGAILQCLQQRLCGLCGQKILGMVYFIGGELSFESRLYSDPGMHLNCARYAIRVCPFLSNPGYKGTPDRHAGDPTILAIEIAQPGRPPKMLLVGSKTYDLATVNDEPHLYALAKEPKIIQEF